MVEFREAPFPGRDAPGGGLLVPLAGIRTIGYAAEETDAGESATSPSCGWSAGTSGST